MDQLYLSLTLFAGVAVLLALSSGGLKAHAWFVSAPLAAVGVGALVGPAALDVLRPEKWGRPHDLLLEVARFSIAMAVMSIALRVPRSFWKQRALLLTLALTIGMFAMWATSAVLAWWALPVSFATALLIGAVVTPTDPVIAGSITTGRLAQQLVPDRVRYSLAAESGANDGAAYAFVTLPMMALLEPGSASWEHWLLDGLLRGILFACILGGAVGTAVGLLQRLAARLRLPGQTTLPSLSIALAVLTLGLLKLLGSDGILGVFVAGVAFNAVVTSAGAAECKQEERQERVQETVNHLVSWPAFLLFGALLPWRAWQEHIAVLVPLALAILLLRRPPWFYVLTQPLAPDGGSGDRLFLAWFGPIGMAAVFYALHAKAHGHPDVWVFASFIILASIIVHGMTATAGTRRYARKARGPQADEEAG